VGFSHKRIERVYEPPPETLARIFPAAYLARAFTAGTAAESRGRAPPRTVSP
jgi:hypothetical protein